MPLCVPPRAEGTPGRALLPDQGGIVLSCVDSCAQCHLCLHSVQRREHYTSPSEIVWSPAYAVLGVLFAPRALPLLAVVSSPLLVLPLGVNVRPAVVSASRAHPLPGDAVQLVLAVLLGVEFRRAVVSASRTPPLPGIDAVQLLLAVPLGVDIRLAVVAAPDAGRSSRFRRCAARIFLACPLRRSRALPLYSPILAPTQCPKRQGRQIYSQPRRKPN
jgi:hypothetical protein